MTEKNSDKKAIIVEAAGQESGLVVDAVAEIIRLEESEIEAANGIANPMSLSST